MTGTALSLKLLGLDPDGRKFGWVAAQVSITSFVGTAEVSDLQVIPVHHFRNAANNIQAAATRGSSVCELLKSKTSYKHHEGFAVFSGSMYAEGRVVIDGNGYRQHSHAARVSMTPGQLQVMMPKKDAARGLVGSTHGTYTISENMDNHPVLGQGSVKLRLLPENTARRSALLDHHRWTETVFNISPEAFCRPVVRGYCLTLKAWGTCAVGNISDVKCNDNAFGALVMPPARKMIPEALVKQQQVHKTDTEIDDVVAGKGQGLVLLLPGVPGTGKILTAESIADHLRIPLYAVSAAELGDTVAEIEAHFGQVSKLAASWNAVLLLDEADAFLEKRTDSPGARDRNKRVAAFLRILEYYKGILVLTTNRIVAFDDAFHSRIHLILPFKALDIPARKSVWTNFLCGAAIEDEEIDSFAAEELNGRQIKNIMKMAKLLAKEGGEDLQAKHIKDVMGLVKEAAEMV